MLRNKIYYRLKPFIPTSVRMAMRKRFSRWIRRRTQDIWPIIPGSEHPPANWPGWPANKKFALVLTHDVEGPIGLNRCRPLMELEMQLGVRSSFNFIPEGTYRVSRELRNELTANGFEVGVHDFQHDGHLFASRREFARKAAHINHYISEWGAAGFRSGFMLHNLDWLHDLDIRYDASTFDTDPFEPQPEGRHTIFPFWVPSPQRKKRNGAVHKDGYVELPYTLPQDSTLFLLLHERTPEIWQRKIDWIAEHGGMALLDTHPDYMSFDPHSKRGGEFDVNLYREFLQYVLRQYEGLFWNPLPRDAAAYAFQALERKPLEVSPQTAPTAPSTPPVKVWIDLDNTPHVPFFIPIIRELENRGHRVVVTARDAFQVCELADRKGLPCFKIGRHYGKNSILKIAGLLWRSSQLLPFYLREKPDIALSHGARSQIFLSNVLRKPTILISDYEFSKTPLLVSPRWEIVPESLPIDGLHSRAERVLKYSGIKEDVYTPDFKPDPSLLEELSIDNEDIIVTVRPPATEAHYHNPESVLLFDNLMAKICATAGVRAILLPRNYHQEKELRVNHPEWFANNKTIIPARAVDGLNLLWYSDLVVSGGGTMNREAAALGVPVYSIFRGKLGGVDRMLEQEGRLVVIRTSAEIETKIRFERREKSTDLDGGPRLALDDIVNHIEDIVRREYPAAKQGNGRAH
jgi:predicted glycosyltransferase